MQARRGRRPRPQSPRRHRARLHPPQHRRAAAAPAPAPAPPAGARPDPPALQQSNALGVARTVEIDTTGGPGFGFEHFKELDFLRDKEVVLTFDDGPWPKNTPAVLKALADECTTGIFFSIGKHATYEPEILKQVYRGRPHRRQPTPGRTPTSTTRS